MEHQNHEYKANQEHLDNKKKIPLNNTWKISAVILGIVAAILLVILFTGKTMGNTVPGNEAGKGLVQYLNQKTNGGVEFISSADKGYLYEIKVRYQGKEIPVYSTKDGKYFVQSAIPLTDQQVMGNNAASVNTPQEVVKSDKPVAEAFIFSYCPYGLQFEKALFSAYELLKDKVDFKIVAIGAMHGEFEKVETLRQISIEQIYGKDKLFSYLKEFDKNTDIGNCRGDDGCLNKYLLDIYNKLSIDKTKIENYMKSDAEKIYNEQNARANNLGVGGSPTFVINGVQVQVNRDSNSIKEVVCEAFNTKPSECSQSLSAQSASAGFG
ncbi:hypothetical protein HYW76_03310 [Candidatus Pacearchaeota archaeon]|nr:hypothetical protein [Candidatus Pacearchaeota archaeon]